jgi:hypothetical protein
MSKQHRFAAVPLIAGAIIALTTASAWAFSQQTLQPNGNYNFDYGPLDNTAKLGESTTKSDPNSPGFHFSVESTQPGQTGSFGLHSFGGSNNSMPSDYYDRLQGKGN